MKMLRIVEDIPIGSGSGESSQGIHCICSALLSSSPPDMKSYCDQPSPHSCSLHLVMGLTALALTGSVCMCVMGGGGCRMGKGLMIHNC